MAIVYPDVTTVNQAKAKGLLAIAGWLFSSEFGDDDSRLGYLRNRYPNLSESRTNQAMSIARSAYTAAQILSRTGELRARQIPRGAINVPPGNKYVYDVTSVIDYNESDSTGQNVRRHHVGRYIVYSDTLLTAGELSDRTNELVSEDLEGDSHYGILLEDIPPGSQRIFFSAVSRI